MGDNFSFIGTAETFEGHPFVYGSQEEYNKMSAFLKANMGKKIRVTYELVQEVTQKGGNH